MPIRSEITFHSMVEAMPNAIVLVNREGLITYVNKQTETLCGFDRVELIGQSIDTLIPERFRAQHPHYRRGYFSEPAPRPMGKGGELFARRKDGSEIPVEIGLNPLITVEGTLVLASIIDITARKKAAERFKLVVESSPSAMLLVGRDGQIAMANHQTRQLFGCEPDELIGASLEQLIPVRYRSVHPEHRARFFQSPSVRPMGVGRDLFALRADGTEVPVEIGLNPIETDEGTFVLASIINIEERKLREAIIERQIHELELKNKELEQFAYIASHDLQEPLRTLMGIVDLFRMEYGDTLDDKAAEFLNYISLSSSRMSNLIRALLEYSRVGKGNMTEIVDCNEVVAHVRQDLAAAITATGAEVATTGDLPRVRGSATDIRLLLQNLLSNAIKFRRSGAPPRIEISARRQESDWLFVVQDNGIGIDERHHDKIFRIFQRLHNRSEYEGTGIGLSHCQKIVELHGGRIWVDSRLGEGSAFHFTIPERNR